MDDATDQSTTEDPSPELPPYVLLFGPVPSGVTRGGKFRGRFPSDVEEAEIVAFLRERSLPPGRYPCQRGNGDQTAYDHRAPDCYQVQHTRADMTPEQAWARPPAPPAPPVEVEGRDYDAQPSSSPSGVRTIAPPPAPAGPNPDLARTLDVLERMVEQNSTLLRDYAERRDADQARLETAWEAVARAREEAAAARSRAEALSEVDTDPGESVSDMITAVGGLVAGMRFQGPPPSPTAGGSSDFEV